MDHRTDPDSSSSSSSPSLLLRRRRHHSPIFLSSCFGPSGDLADPNSPTGGGAAPSPPLPSPSTWSNLPSPSTWFRSKAQDFPDLRQKYRNLVCRGGGRHHRRHHSADLRYDPLSYALNFDDGGSDEAAENASSENLRYRTFSARLPASPPRPVRGRKLQSIGSGREAPL